MRKKVFACLQIFFILGLSAAVGYAQSMEKTIQTIKDKTNIEWENNELKIPESQGITITHCQITLERVTIFKSGKKAVQKIVIPVDQIDSARIDAIQSVSNENIYSILIHSKNNNNVIEVIDFIDGKMEGETFETDSAPIYSYDIKKKDELINAVKHLVNLCKGN